MKKYITQIKLIIAISLISLSFVSSFSHAVAGSTGAPLTPSLTGSYRTDLMTGSAVMTVPIEVPPGRKGMQPDIKLIYSSDNPNGICGVGWMLELGNIQRNTKKGIPKYDNTDTFIAFFGGASMELVDIGGGEYRAKTEGAFMKFTFDGTSWQVKDKSGTTYFFGSGAGSRQTNTKGTFKWCLDKVMDVNGNYLTVAYFQDQGQIYPQKIEYTGKEGADSPTNTVDFIYKDDRTDALSNYRSNFEVKTAKRLWKIESKASGELARRYELNYSPEASRSLLTSVTQYGTDGTSSLPPITFTYQTGSTIGQ